MPTQQARTYDLAGNLVKSEQVEVPAEQVVADSLRQKAEQVIAVLEQRCGTKATWDGLDAAQRQETTRLGLLAVAKIARLVLGRLDAA